ncbi:hypothetical protein [Enterococcus casseliflavus]|uniref:hypothetical protein n=1 Tax=Enterococcus casseliflavus TaxID=37734 RepID=UPI002542B5F1|nr:hypothetical protein [Enterococcus casseliflavus]MDK4448972.1 hypothetical protein [Enterococcus casseliflavus]
MKKIILTTAILASLALGFGGATTAHADSLLDEVINTIKNSDYADTEDVQKTLEETVDKADISGITDEENAEAQANNIVDAFDTNDLNNKLDNFLLIPQKINEHTSETIKYQKESTENFILKSLNTVTVFLNGNADEQLQKEALTKDMTTAEKIAYKAKSYSNNKIFVMLFNLVLLIITIIFIKTLVDNSKNKIERTKGTKRSQINNFKSKAKQDAVRGLGLTKEEVIWLILLPFKLVILPFKLAFYLTTFVVLAFKTAYKIIKIQYNWLSHLFLVIKSKPIYNFKKIK